MGRASRRKQDRPGPDEQRQRAGLAAAQLLDVVDEEFLAAYTEAGDALAVLLSLMIRRGLSPEAAFGQMHVLVVGVQMEALKAVSSG